MKATALLACLMAVLLTTTSAYAEIPDTMEFSGFLSAGGVAMEGDHEMMFTLYDAQEGGDIVWQGEYMVPIKSGAFSVLLGGDDNPLDETVFSSKGLWLSVNIGDEQMSPRSPITAVPFAVRAAHADNVPDKAEIQEMVEEVGYLKGESDPSVNALGKALLNCETGQKAGFDGSGWACVDDVDRFEPNTDALAALRCDDGEVPKSVDGQWACATDADSVGPDTDTLRNLGCLDSETAFFNGELEAWECGTFEVVESDPSFAASAAASIDILDVTDWREAFLWGDHAEAGYLTEFTEADPAFAASVAAAIETGDIERWNEVFAYGNHADAGYLTEFTEADPAFAASVAAAIASDDISVWNEAFSWGDHADAGYLTNFDESDPEFAASIAATINDNDVNAWNESHDWGDHAEVGYLTSFTESDPEFAASVAASIEPTDLGHWNQAFGWGNHADAGYLTFFGETDPVFASSAASTITALSISSWDAAFSFGNHADAGYLTGFTETDPAFAASAAASITNGDTANWDEAHGWGDHADAGYLTGFTESNPGVNDLGKATLDCENGEIAKFVDGAWACAADGGGGGGATDIVYGDGSAGALVIDAVTDWVDSPPSNINFQFTTCNINAALTVPAGTVLRCTGDLTIAAGGSIVVESVPAGFEQGIPTNPSNTGDSGYLFPTKAANRIVVAQILNPPMAAGGSGHAGPGGSLVLRVGGNVSIAGNIVADGASSGGGAYFGGSGGAGGFVIIASRGTITSTGTIAVRGGNGGQGQGLYNGFSHGPGGGGGVVHLLASSITEGTIDASGGSRSGSATCDGYGSYPGGSFGGKGGRGCDNADGDPTTPTDGGDGYLIKTVVDNPGYLFR